MDFVGNHILSVSQFDRDDIERVFEVADMMRPYAHREVVTRVLEGAILGNMFFEPSTRTRVSFGCAFNLLGGEVRETTEVRASSLAKGESLFDTARVLSGYSDVIVMRHELEGSVQQFAKASRCPVLNAGDGANEHPSQALLDLYTIKRELATHGKTIDGMRITLIGDLKYGRAVHSLVQMLTLYSNIRVSLISAPELALPSRYIDALRLSGHEVIESDRLEDGIAQADILYVTRTQEERFGSQAEADKYKGIYKVNRNIYTEFCEPNTVIMHPLPRDSRENASDLDADLNENPNLAIFRQTDNGVLIRMALFALILDVVGQISRHSRKVNWYTAKRF
ncbi:MAG: aspartate carbamoyltransferase [Gammaproteobacteria bacterium]|nr:aspartate carbamoyltransferase [Gammaproteobacteria bacterium]